MIVTTKNGKKYLFTIFNNSIRFQIGVQEMVVTDFKDFTVGQKLCVKGYMFDMYGRTSQEPCLYRSSTPIVSIK